MAQIAAAVGGSLLGGIASGKGAKQAAQIQAQSQANQLAEQQRQFNITQQNYAPYLAAGQSALGAQGNLLGLNGNDAQQQAIGTLQTSPLFTSLDQAGQDALLQSAAATGGLRGGNTQTALYNQRSSLLANVIQNQLSNLSGVSSMGVGATGAIAGAGQNSANAIGNIYQQQGNTGASNALAQSSILGRTFNDLSGILQNSLANSGTVNATTAGLQNYAAGIGQNAANGLFTNSPQALGVSFGGRSF